MIATLGLRAFRAVMEVGSMSAASDRLGRTQPQISRLVSELEAELGFPLFARERRRLLPTNRAHKFYETVCSALDSLDAVKSAGEALRHTTDLQLRIVAPPYASYTVIPEAMARYRRHFPNDRFSHELITRAEMGRWLAYHPFDVGIASLPFDAPGIEITPLAKLPSVVVMPLTHPLAEKSCVDLVDLARYPFIALNSYTLIRRQLDKIIERAGIVLDIVGETDTGLAACHMVAEDLGITVVDRLWIDAIPPGLVIHRPWRPGLVSTFGLIRPAANPMDARTTKIAQIIADIFVERYGADGMEPIRP